MHTTTQQLTNLCLVACWDIKAVRWIRRLLRRRWRQQLYVSLTQWRQQRLRAWSRTWSSDRVRRSTWPSYTGNTPLRSLRAWLPPFGCHWPYCGPTLVQVQAPFLVELRLDTEQPRTVVLTALWWQFGRTGWGLLSTGSSDEWPQAMCAWLGRRFHSLSVALRWSAVLSTQRLADSYLHGPVPPL